jgi:hypothetical protein
MHKDGHLIDAARKPVYALTGRHDTTTLFPDRWAAALSLRLPGVEYREMKRPCHLEASDHPVGFCEAIIPILDELIATTA